MASRIKFLPTVHNLTNSEDDRPVYYQTKHALTKITHKSVSDKAQQEREAWELQQEQRWLTVSHAGPAKTGFLPNSCWIFHSRS
jgi:hypothetical protein